MQLRIVIHKSGIFVMATDNSSLDTITNYRIFFYSIAICKYELFILESFSKIIKSSVYIDFMDTYGNEKNNKIFSNLDINHRNILNLEKIKLFLWTEVQKSVTHGINQN